MRVIRRRLLAVAGLLPGLTGCDGCLPDIPDYNTDTGIRILDAGEDTGGPTSDTGEQPLEDTGTDNGDTGPVDEPSGDIGDTTPVDVDPFPGLNLAQVSDEVFGERCAACHIDRASPILWLAANDGLRDRLLAPAVQLPTMPLVTPGDPEHSYLWHKVNGTQADVGGLGGAMPFGESSLSADQLLLLRTWIERGAP